MGSMLLAAVPSKSSKNTSRIHNPLAFPRHAISTLTPSKCGPIYRRNGRYILRVLGFSPPLFFGKAFSLQSDTHNNRRASYTGRKVEGDSVGSWRAPPGSTVQVYRRQILRQEKLARSPRMETKKKQLLLHVRVRTNSAPTP